MSKSSDDVGLVIFADPFDDLGKILAGFRIGFRLHVLYNILYRKAGVKGVADIDDAVGFNWTLRKPLDNCAVNQKVCSILVSLNFITLAGWVASLPVRMPIRLDKGGINKQIQDDENK